MVYFQWNTYWVMLKQFDCSLTVSLDYDSWLGALSLANYQPIHLERAV